jgi:hypothetical protein
MNPKKTETMLYPLIIMGCIWLVLKLASAPTHKSFAQRRIDYMRQRQRDLLHQIRFTPTTTALEDTEDEVHGFFELYKFVEGVKGLTSELHAALHNKREELRGYKKVRA